MRAILLFIFLAGTFACRAEVSFENHFMRIHLKGDWTKAQSLAKSQLSFSSEALSAGVTISETPMSAESTDLQRVADELLRLRFEAEKEIQPNNTLSYGKPWSTKYEDGLQVNYMGHDNFGRHFFFTGLIVKKRVISVYGELHGGTEAALHRLYQEILSSIEYETE